MDLKDYKRISTGSEFRDVVQIANDEPRFRQNGHELVFESANIDYLEGLNNKVTTTLDELSFSIRLRTPSEFSTLIQQVFFLNYADSTNFFQVYVNKESGALIVFAFDSSGSTVTIGTSYILTTNTDYLLEWDGLNGEFKVNDSVVYTLANPSSYSFITDTTKPFRISQGNSGRQMSMILFGYSLNNETFNPTDIDSNAQIEGSSGTVATVNTSHASGLSYILGTVFQKSSFALAFDGANSEYLEDTTQTGTITNTDDIDVDIDFTVNDWLGASGAQGIIAIGSDTNYFYVSKWVADNQILVSVISGATSYTRGFTITPQTKNKLRINGGQMFFNGVEFGAGTGFNNQAINVDKSIVRFGARSVDTTTTLSGIIYPNPIVQGVNYPLTEGLGNTTNGATINTSHADGIKRINFGMWQKNGNVLALESANGDYLRTSNFSLTKISDITFKQKLNIDFNVVELRGLLSFGVGGNYFFLYITSSNRIVIEGFSDDGVNFFTQGSVINGNELVEFDGVKLYLNGVVDIDLTSFGQLNFVSNSPSSFYLSRVSFQSARYYTGIIEGFELMGKTFNLREGQGTTITSEDGTATATINTSHASGGTYIDEEVWQESKQKWIDYKQQ